MNVAYVISAYKLPALLVRLVRRLQAPGVTTWIHVDRRTDDGVYRAMADPLRELSDVYFLERHACHWGDFGHVRATLKGLRALVSSGVPFDYVVLLTGQDYPLKAHDEIAARLARSSGQVFMDWMPVPNEVWSDRGTDRFRNWHFRLGGRHVAFPGAPFRSAGLNALWTLPARALGLYRSFPPGVAPFGGSSYWMMPADCARFVDRYVHENPAFVRFFEHVWVPDEMFFQTIVLNSDFRERMAPDDLRFIDWREDLDNPRVLTSTDFDRLRASDALFARKFDPGVDEAVLDRIDGELARAF